MRKKSKFQNPNFKFKIRNPRSVICNSQAGLTLIEVLIALTVLAIGLLGVALMQVSSISGNSFSREMGVATTLGQDMVEKLITLDYTASTRDAALNAGNHPTTSDVTANLAPAVFGNAANRVDERGLWAARATTLGTSAGNLIYTRTWAVTDNSPATNMLNIAVTVSWTEGGTSSLRSITITGIKVRS
jgi:type IV pilus assembly protein PilV